MRLAGFIGLAGGFLYFYQRSARTSFHRISLHLEVMCGGRGEDDKQEHFEHMTG